jgi:hypothetical protein
MRRDSIVSLTASLGAALCLGATCAVLVGWGPRGSGSRSYYYYGVDAGPAADASWVGSLLSGEWPAGTSANARILDTAAPTILGCDAECSFSFWFRPNEPCSTGTVLASHDMEQSNGWRIQCESDGPFETIKVVLNNGRTIVAAAPLTLLAWYHVVWVYDGSLGSADDRSALYIQAAPQVLTITGDPNPAELDLSGGGWFALRPNYINRWVNLDEATYWQRALDPLEVIALFNSGAPGYVDTADSDLLGWWRLGEYDGAGSITAVVDSSSYEHDLVLYTANTTGAAYVAEVPPDAGLPDAPADTGIHDDAEPADTGEHDDAADSGYDSGVFADAEPTDTGIHDDAADSGYDSGVFADAAADDAADSNVGDAWIVQSVFAHTPDGGFVDTGATGTQYATISDSPLLEPSDAFTFSIWLYPSACSSAEENIFGKWITTGDQRAMRFYKTSGGCGLSVSLSSAGSDSVNSNFGASLTANAWNHVVLAYSGARAIPVDAGSSASDAGTQPNYEQVALWVDGVRKMVAITGVSAIYDSTSDWKLGCYGACAAVQWGGYQAQATMWTGAIAQQADVDALYNSGSPIDVINVLGGLPNLPNAKLTLWLPRTPDGGSKTIVNAATGLDGGTANATWTGAAPTDYVTSPSLP